MSYTTDALIRRVKLKAFTSTSSSLGDSDFRELLEDSFRSFIVPFTKALREEFWVGKQDIVLTTDANSQVEIPDTIASTLRTVFWPNNGVPVPLTRVEPEAAYPYLAQGSSVPVGFMMRGYTLQVLPPSPGTVIHVTAMLRPPSLCFEADAARVTSHIGPVLTLASVPVAWQSSAPTSVDIVSANSPFSPVATTVPVSSLVGGTLTLATDPGLVGEVWAAPVGQSPFPNIPIELMPLLELDVVATLFQGLGDKRLQGILQRKDELEKNLRRTLSPRMQGNARPIVNPSAPGMRGWGRR